MRILAMPATPIRTSTAILITLACMPIGAEAAHSSEPEAAPPAPREVRQAVESGLDWLVARQVKDGAESGSWEGARYKSAVASLAGLALLANGHLPGNDARGEAVKRAMGYVLPTMRSDGYLGGSDDSMYVHAICTLFGLAYLGMAGDEARDKDLAEWCRKSIELIVSAQKARKFPGEEGGWRYTPQDGTSDLSVTSWQLLVLHAARQSGYEIDDAVFERAMKYINAAYAETDAERTGYLYRLKSSKEPEPGVTGVAVLMKGLLEPEPDERVRKSVRYLRRFKPAWGGGYKGYFYFENFYLAQGMFQLGGEAWQEFAPPLQRVLIDHQESDGSWPFPPGAMLQSREAGPAYATAMGVLILSLERQYLPMYQRQRRLF